MGAARRDPDREPGRGGGRPAAAEVDRLRRAAKKEPRCEPFERHLADACAALLSGSGSDPARRFELVVMVSHEVAQRGWSEVRDGEVCKIPGVGPTTTTSNRTTPAGPSGPTT